MNAAGARTSRLVARFFRDSPGSGGACEVWQLPEDRRRSRGSGGYGFANWRRSWETVRRMGEAASEVPAFREALRFWWRLGWISFGGPAGQIAIMHREVVERRGWLDERAFLSALNFCMLLPGPEAQQLAIYLGWKLHGTRGGVAAGVLFVLPSALILFGLSWIYVAAGELEAVRDVVRGLSAAVIAILLGALEKLGRRALRTRALAGIALGAFAAIFFFGVPFPAIVAGAAAVGFLIGRKWPTALGPVEESEPGGVPRPKRGGRALRVAGVGLALWWLPVLGVAGFFGADSTFARQGFFFSKAALVTFGGAYAVLPYVADQAVERFGWLSEAQMVAGLSLAETTPGPLVMVLQFVGFVGGWRHPEGLSPLAGAAVGAAITTWVTFLPCFLFVLLGAPHVERLRASPWLARAMSAVTAAVVGVILNLAVWFAWHAAWPPGGRLDGTVITVAAGAWFALQVKRVPLPWVLAACGAAGCLAGRVG